MMRSLMTCTNRQILFASANEKSGAPHVARGGEGRSAYRVAVWESANIETTLKTLPWTGG